MPIHAALLPVLVLCVILVNGWTDAPNAIATAVGSGALSFRPAVALAAVCNFAGVALACLCFPAVAATMENLVRFSSPQDTQAGLCGALLAVILWGVAAWRFGLPTSESHALLAGLSGAALALGADIQPSAWVTVGAGLVLSLPAGVVAGRAVCRGLGCIPHNPMAGQRAAAALTAFLHGAQDGQKFLALLLMAQGVSAARPPLPLLLLTACTMALGTGLGGRRIIDTVGRDMVCLGPREGFAADLAGIACLLLATVLGLPVSTTHTRTAALLGVGSAGGRAADWGVARSIALAWLCTFPGCMGLGWLLAEAALRVGTGAG